MPNSRAYIRQLFDLDIHSAPAFLNCNKTSKTQCLFVIILFFGYRKASHSITEELPCCSACMERVPNINWSNILVNPKHLLS